MKSLLTFLLLALTGGPAAAQDRLVIMNGNELHQECQARSNVCVGFIMGVADALEALSYPTPKTCRPDRVELQQILDLGRMHIENNPAERHRAAFDILADLFSETWPCR